MDTGSSKFDLLPVGDVKLDVSNPRIAKWLEMYGDEIKAEDMSLALGAGGSQEDATGTTFFSLKESIRTNGGIIHPIIVSKGDDEELVVIEGNTRTLIYREFLEADVPGAWSNIPAMVYEGLGQAQIDAIRLQAHLVGPRPWDPYSKAKYLDHLRNAEHLTLSQIVDFCGGRKKEVQDYISAFHDMETFYRPLLDSDDQFDASRFSAFIEIQSPRRQEALGFAGFNKTNFSQWVIDGLFPRLDLIRQLPRILENKASRDIFLRDGAREALKALEAPASDESLKDASLVHLAKELSRRILKITLEEIQRLRTSGGTDECDDLVEARDQLEELCKEIVSEE